MSTKNIVRNTLLASVISTCALGAQAEVKGWSGKGEAGAIIVSGNSESEVINLGAEISRKQADWTHTGKVAVVKASSNDVDSAESYMASWLSQKDISENVFLFGDVRYFDDQFDSFNEIYTGNVGAGYRVFQTDAIKWDLSVGVGYKDTSIESTNEEISGATGLFGSKYAHKLSDTTELTNDTRVEYTADNTFVQNVLGLSVSMSSALALKLAYDVRYNSDVSDDQTSTDRITSVNVVYNF